MRTTYCLPRPLDKETLNSLKKLYKLKLLGEIEPINILELGGI